MASEVCQRAAQDAIRIGTALLKFVSPNDTGVTGSHQRGFYLPLHVWQFLTPQEPVRGVNHDHPVEVEWHDGRRTASCVKWYGRGTRFEYRLTRFGRHFPHLIDESVGNLLVLIPVSIDRFLAYVLDTEEDIDDLQAMLGVGVLDATWALYQRAAPSDEDDCLDAEFAAFVGALEAFPPGLSFSNAAWEALLRCSDGFWVGSADSKLMAALAAEYRLFRLVEGKLCAREIERAFTSIDEFLKTALTITQRRKARAGQSLENHVERILHEAGLPFDAQPDADGTKPDILIPGVAQYRDQTYPVDRLFVVGLKTTCRDRWRQVTQEGPRTTKKYIITTQPGISGPQLRQMRDSSVTLVVPETLHNRYPPIDGLQMFTLSDFIDMAREAVG